MKKTYLFDFDGTLVDSMPIYASVMLQILDEAKINYGADLMRTITPLGVEGSAEYFCSLGVPLTKDEIISRMKNAMLGAYFHSIPAKDGVVEGIRRLAGEGARLSILTASPHVTLDACLKRLEIGDCFEFVWSCEDFGTTKADPEIYRMAAKKLGVPTEDVLFLDDNFHALRTAKEVGMRVCGVFDETSADEEEDMRAFCDGYIRKFCELFTLGLV